MADHFNTCVWFGLPRSIEHIDGERGLQFLARLEIGQRAAWIGNPRFAGQMTLLAHAVASLRGKTRGVDDVRARWMQQMRSSRPVAAIAGDGHFTHIRRRVTVDAGCRK